MALDKTV